MNKSYQVFKLAKNKVDFLPLYRLNAAYYPALLETVLSDNQQRCFDILFCNPIKTIRLDVPSDDKPIEQNFLNVFNQHWLKESRIETDNEVIPFRGGWFVYFSYELAQQIEPVLELPQATSQLPVAYASRFKSALIFDHKKNQTFLICETDLQSEPLLARVKADIEKCRSLPQTMKLNFNQVDEDIEQTYLDSVQQVKKYILDGDVFQVNLSRQWDIQLKGTEHHAIAASLYERLRMTNPAPFAGLVSIGNGSIISSSPERLVKVANGCMESRPIAGTRPRSDNLQQDKEYLQQLHRHPKEKAEHIMLIDLIRNDLGRVCQPGSIKVNELMINESYAHVHHIVSNVRGEVRQGVLPGDIIRAIFPGGTITGCPKVRCMEIIAEQEKVARNAYTGSFGYINNDGSMDLNILIRSMLLEQKDYQQHLSFRAGAGLVADSNAQHELNETRAKALGLLKVFE